MRFQLQVSVDRAILRILLGGALKSRLAVVDWFSFGIQLRLLTRDLLVVRRGGSCRAAAVLGVTVVSVGGRDVEDRIAAIGTAQDGALARKGVRKTMEAKCLSYFVEKNAMC